MSQVMTLVVLVLEPGAPPAKHDVSAALLSSRRHIDQPELRGRVRGFARLPPGASRGHFL
jgi:hypothetical protein